MKAVIVDDTPDTTGADCSKADAGVPPSYETLALKVAQHEEIVTSIQKSNRITTWKQLFFGVVALTTIAILIYLAVVISSSKGTKDPTVSLTASDPPASSSKTPEPTPSITSEASEPDATAPAPSTQSSEPDSATPEQPSEPIATSSLQPGPPELLDELQGRVDVCLQQAKALKEDFNREKLEEHFDSVDDFVAACGSGGPARHGLLDAFQQVNDEFQLAIKSFYQDLEKDARRYPKLPGSADFRKQKQAQLFRKFEDLEKFRGLLKRYWWVQKHNLDGIFHNPTFHAVSGLYYSGIRKIPDGRSVVVEVFVREKVPETPEAERNVKALAALCLDQAKALQTDFCKEKLGEHIETVDKFVKEWGFYGYDQNIYNVKGQFIEANRTFFTALRLFYANAEREVMAWKDMDESTWDSAQRKKELESKYEWFNGDKKWKYWSALKPDKPHPFGYIVPWTASTNFDYNLYHRSLGCLSNPIKGLYWESFKPQYSVM